MESQPQNPDLRKIPENFHPEINPFSTDGIVHLAL